MGRKYTTVRLTHTQQCYIDVYDDEILEGDSLETAAWELVYNDPLSWELIDDDFEEYGYGED